MAFEFEPQEVFEVRCEGIVTASDIFLTRWFNTWHVARDAEEALDQDDEPGIYGLVAAVALAMHGRYSANVIPLLSDQCAITQTRAKIIAPFESTFAVQGTATPGEIVEPVDEPDDAVVVTKRTFRAGRSFLGRVYLPGAADTDVEGGVITEVLASGIADSFHTLIASPLQISGVDFRAGVWSQVTYDLAPAVNVAFAELASIEVDRVMRKQSRRDIKERYPIIGAED